VIARLRALFVKKGVTNETFDLNETTREVLSLVSSDLLRNRVSVRVDIDDTRPLVITGDRVQLQQVILNLLRNASDAMSAVDDRTRSLLVSIAAGQDGDVRVSVKDAGVGLEPRVAERIFDPFYTTKVDGMGIGLSVSRSIIEGHGGRLWVERNDGPGATFSFSIPRQETSDGVRSDAWTLPTTDAPDPMRNA
jgi:signal transduction histidine kinase